MNKNGLICGVLAFVCAALLAADVAVIKTNHQFLRTGDTAIVFESKRYPDSHWKNRVSTSCMNCRHNSVIGQHWGKDCLYCENCKSVHTGRLTKHYMYDTILPCQKCGHKSIAPRVHNRTEVNCSSCH